MNHLRLTILLLTLLFAACAHAPLRFNSGQQDDVEIVQGGIPVACDADGLLRLRSDQFEIRSRWPLVNVCISKSKADLGKISAGMNVWRDMGTCLNLGKSYAMDDNSDFLVVGEGVNALNEEHGLQRSERYYWYLVRSLFDENSREQLSLAQADGRYYAVIWVDKNSDYNLDDGEFVLVTLLLERGLTNRK
ncbi:MAG: hypothetical protein HYV06_08860 [Deltaproteobacteria bacterium]|nr:hypothetical protein [Deltaproteobacteria bacterium]